MMKKLLLSSLSYLLVSLLAPHFAQGQCQLIQAQLVNSFPVAVNNTIKICQGETVAFTGSGTFENSSAGATYEWFFGDGSSASGTSVTHVYPIQGVYIVDLVITDSSGCNNTNRIDLAVQVSTTPIFAGTNANPAQICLGETSVLTGVATPVPGIYECAPPVSDTTFLPDGSGVSYTTSIEVECFAPTTTLSDPSQLESVCINMEHSYLGDLQISISCPNGQTAILKPYPGGAGTYLGGANDDNSLAMGEGETYCFSMSAAWGTILQENALGNWVTAGSNPPNNSMTPGTYQPEQSFNNLVGCPLNGDWTITVTDNLSIDNGYIFWWGINFDPALLPGNYSFLPQFVSESWNASPDISGGGGNQIQVTPSTGGNHCYTFTVTDDFNCTYDTTICIVVIDPGNPGLDSAATICLNESPVNLFNYLAGNPETGGFWSGLGVSGTGVFDPQAVGEGTYVLTYTKSVGGLCDTSATVTMTVNNNVNLDFQYTLSKGCSGDTVFFNNLSEPGLYWWKFGDGSPIDSINVNPSHYYTPPDQYSVVLTGMNALGCKDSITKIVDTRHPIQAIFGQSTDSVCQSGNNNVIFFDQSTGNIDSWFWDFGDGTTSTLQGPTHSYTLAGTHTIMLVVQEAGLPCMDTAFGTVYVDSTPHIIVMADRDTVCNGERINFSLDYLHTATLLTWDFGDGSSLVGLNASPFHSYDNPGTYTVSVKGDYPVCNSVTDKLKVLIKPFPIVNLGPDTTLCLNGTPYSLWDTVNISNPNIQWRWNTGDSTAVLKIVHPGTYSVEADLDGCKTTDEIVVRKDCYSDVPNAFTPNNDGVNDYFFPRQFLSEGIAGFRMTIFNRWGEKIFETTRTDGRGWDGTLNGKEQPVGVYIYVIDVEYKNKATEHYEGNVTLIR